MTFQYIFLFMFGFFRKKLTVSGQNIIDNEIKLHYYETISLKENFGEVYMGNPSYNVICTVVRV